MARTICNNQIKNHIRMNNKMRTSLEPNDLRWIFVRNFPQTVCRKPIPGRIIHEIKHKGPPTMSRIILYFLIFFLCSYLLLNLYYNYKWFDKVCMVTVVAIICASEASVGGHTHWPRRKWWMRKLPGARLWAPCARVPSRIIGLGASRIPEVRVQGKPRVKSRWFAWFPLFFGHSHLIHIWD